MPELPEVETTRRGIEPHILGRTVNRVIVRERRLRWPIPAGLAKSLTGQKILSVRRRAKYLLLETATGTAIVHLGMSGSLRIADPGSAPRKHDHVDLVFDSGKCLRLHDPRRFGALLWTRDKPEAHKLIRELGPEPLDKDFSADLLFDLSRGRKVAVKNFIMNAHIVVGVGNIYANEALFSAGIHPNRPAGKISKKRYVLLVDEIKKVLRSAIKSGGTTLRDFVNSEGKPGYFQQTLNVYGRDGEPCRQCGSVLKLARIGQRASVYCGQCQK